MPPSNLLRAMQPLRSTVMPPKTSTTLLQSRQFLTTTPTLASSTKTKSTTISTPKSTLTPPSLRAYPYKIKTGTVTSVGRMDRTVRVAHHHNFWDSYLRKNYPKTTYYLVSDPRNSLREGDVIEFSSGFPKSRTVRHVVERIVAPFGTGIEEREAVMSREEREKSRVEKRSAKWERREKKRVESGGQQGVKEHVGRVRKLVLERTAAAEEF